jgi:N-acetylmuramic acid 6-phosphate etherase
MMNETDCTAATAAHHFIANEKEFHLGVLPTEQPHPKTVGLAEAAQAETGRAIHMIQQVDCEVLSTAERALSDRAFIEIRAAMARAWGEEINVRLPFSSPRMVLG